MTDNKNSSSSPPCGPDCSCKTEKGLSVRTRLILVSLIVVCAGAAIAAALVRKSQQTPVPPSSSYSSALSITSAAQVKTDSSSQPAVLNKTVSFEKLSSLGSLDSMASNYDGVFILLVKNETQKTPAIAQEIGIAAAAITGRGLHMGVFQLAAGTPDFESLASKIPSPGVVVVVKGRGMRAVAGADITRTNLLQACVAATQPSGCCAAGGNHACR
jgi:hypothetical protein